MIGVGDIVTWKDSTFGPGAAVWRVTEVHHGTTATLEHLRRPMTNVYRLDLLRPLTARERAEAGIRIPGTPSSSPGRHYTIGLPVTITVHNVGTVSATVHVEDASGEVAHYDGGDPDLEPDPAVLDSDSALIEQALSTTDYSVRLD